MVALNRESLQEKILDGRRVSAAEALALYRWPLAELGALADARRNLAKEKTLWEPGPRDRHLHRRPQHQLHQRLQRLLQVLRVLPDGEGRTIITCSRFEQLDQKLDELTAIGGVQILMQGGHHPKLGIRLVPRRAPRTSGKNIRTSTSTGSARRSSIISPRSSRCRCARCSREFKEAGLGIDPRRRRRDSGRSRARTDRAAEMQDATHGSK